MFETTSHDFGTVAKNSLTEFEFRLRNTYQQDIQIQSVTSSCGCTTPRITKRVLGTHEVGSIVAHFNTDRFTGGKGAKLTVTFGPRFQATVELNVRGHIREDIVLSPGSVRLGTVRRGTPTTKTIEVSCPDSRGWRPTGVSSANPHLTARVISTRNDWERTTYQLQVHLDGQAPAGYIQDHLMLLSNDSRRTNIPVLVEGRVSSQITIAPGTLTFGPLVPGQQMRRALVLRSEQPLKITGVSADAGEFEFDVPTKDEPRTVHVIHAVYLAPDVAPGNFLRRIRVDTDQGGSVSRTCSVMMVAPSPSTTQAPSDADPHTVTLSGTP